MTDEDTRDGVEGLVAYVAARYGPAPGDGDALRERVADLRERGDELAAAAPPNGVGPVTRFEPYRGSDGTDASAGDGDGDGDGTD